MFDGHRLYKISKNWVFDLTEFIGYKVEFDRYGNIEHFEKAFVVRRYDNGYYFEKNIPTPMGVIRKTKNTIDNYMREALIYG